MNKRKESKQMKYLVILYINYNNGTADKKSIYEAKSSDEAVATFHTEMGKAMKDENVAHVMCKAMNSDGGEYESKS